MCHASHTLVIFTCRRGYDFDGMSGSRARIEILQYEAADMVSFDLDDVSGSREEIEIAITT